MTDLATLHRLYRHMIHIAADAFEEGNERLASQAMDAADHLATQIGRMG